MPLEVPSCVAGGDYLPPLATQDREPGGNLVELYCLPLRPGDLPPKTAGLLSKSEAVVSAFSPSYTR